MIQGITTFCVPIARPHDACPVPNMVVPLRGDTVRVSLTTNVVVGFGSQLIPADSPVAVSKRWLRLWRKLYYSQLWAILTRTLKPYFQSRKESRRLRLWTPSFFRFHVKLQGIQRGSWILQTAMSRRCRHVLLPSGWRSAKDLRALRWHEWIKTGMGGVRNVQCVLFKSVVVDTVGYHDIMWYHENPRHGFLHFAFHFFRQSVWCVYPQPPFGARFQLNICCIIMARILAQRICCSRVIAQNC